MEIESIRAKLNKSSGDQDKLTRQLDAALTDCDNKKVREEFFSSGLGSYMIFIILFFLAQKNRIFTCYPLV